MNRIAAWALAALLGSAPAHLLAQGRFEVDGEGVDGEAVEVPDWLGPDSQNALEEIAEIADLDQAEGLLVVALIYGAASPEGAAAVFAPSPDAADALSAMDDIQRARTRDVIETLLVVHDDKLTPEERAFWNAAHDYSISSFPASSAGEPHISTFDALEFDFQAAGEFIAARGEDGFEAQIRLAPWGTLDTVSVNTAAAFRIGRDRVSITYGAEPPVRVNGVATVLDDATVILDGGGLLAEHDGVVSLFWPDGSVARVTFTHLRHLDVALRAAAARAGGVAGLFGNFDGEPGNDLVRPDGVRVTLPGGTDPEPYLRALYSEFGDAWRVTATNSLFDYADGESTATFQRRGMPRTRLELEDLGAPRRADALAVCRRAGVPVDLLDECTFDVAVTGEPGFAQSALTVASLRVSETYRVAADSLAGTAIASTVTGSAAVDRHPLYIPAERAVFVQQESFAAPLDLVNVGVFTATGEPVKRQCFGCGLFGLVRVPSPGLYYLQAGPGDGAASGDYAVRYWLVPPPERFAAAVDTVIGVDSPGPGAGRIELPGATDEYSIPVAGPMRIRIQVLSFDPALDLVPWALVDPAGEVVARRCFGCGAEALLDVRASGTHVLRVGAAERDAGRGEYSLRLAFEAGQP